MKKDGGTWTVIRNGHHLLSFSKIGSEEWKSRILYAENRVQAYGRGCHNQKYQRPWWDQKEWDETLDHHHEQWEGRSFTTWVSAIKQKGCRDRVMVIGFTGHLLQKDRGRCLAHSTKMSEWLSRKKLNNKTRKSSVGAAVNVLSYGADFLTKKVLWDTCEHRLRTLGDRLRRVAIPESEQLNVSCTFSLTNARQTYPGLLDSLGVCG